MAIKYFKSPKYSATFRNSRVSTDFIAVADKPMDTTLFGYSPTMEHPAGIVTVFSGKELMNRDLTYSDELFTHVPPKIETAFVDRRIHTAAAPTLLGMAYNEARKTGIPTYSSDLSHDSSRLVKKALKKGLVKSNSWNEEAEQTNTVPLVGQHVYTLRPGTVRVMSEEAGSGEPVETGDRRHITFYEHVTGEEKKEGMKTVRNIVRPSSFSKPSLNKTQFEQLRLDL